MNDNSIEWEIPDNEDEIIADMEYLLLIMKTKRKQDRPINSVVKVLKSYVHGLDKKLNG